MLGDALWSARVLADQPDAVRSVHEAYIDAGARVIVTASYQVSRQGFEAAGRSARDADEALARSVRLGHEAVAGRDVLVAASVGPYGAILHDGSEYRGRYGVPHARLVDFHRERLEVLVAADPDLLAIETIPDADEVLALAAALADHPGMPAWISLSCRDESTTSAGQPVEDAAGIAASVPQVRAVGVNCTSPDHVTSLLGRMASAGLPLIAYPNTGRAWDPESGWQGPPRGLSDDDLREWSTIAALLGGCCGIGPEGIADAALATGARRNLDSH